MKRMISWFRVRNQCPRCQIELLLFLILCVGMFLIAWGIYPYRARFDAEAIGWIIMAPAGLAVLLLWGVQWHHPALRRTEPWPIGKKSWVTWVGATLRSELCRTELEMQFVWCVIWAWRLAICVEALGRPIGVTTVVNVATLIVVGYVWIKSIYSLVQIQDIIYEPTVHI
jgi:hypothetical protein